MVYKYFGPVYMFGKVYADRFSAQTTAKSPAQAANFLAYQASKKYGFDVRSLKINKSLIIAQA